MNKRKSLYIAITGSLSILILVGGYLMMPMISRLHQKQLLEKSETVRIEINQNTHITEQEEQLGFPWNTYIKSKTSKISKDNKELILVWDMQNTLSELSKLATLHGIDVDHYGKKTDKKRLGYTFDNLFLANTISELRYMELGIDATETNVTLEDKYFFYKGVMEGKEISYVLYQGTVRSFRVEDVTTKTMSATLLKEADQLKEELERGDTSLNQYADAIYEVIGQFMEVESESIEGASNRVEGPQNNEPNIMIAGDMINVVYKRKTTYLVLYYDVDKKEFCGFNLIS